MAYKVQPRSDTIHLKILKWKTDKEHEQQQQQQQQRQLQQKTFTKLAINQPKQQ